MPILIAAGLSPQLHPDLLPVTREDFPMDFCVTPDGVLGPFTKPKRPHQQEAGNPNEIRQQT